MSEPTVQLTGVFAAAVTPLKADLQADLDALPQLLDFLAGRGCHGVLLMGTTGEGTSLSLAQREHILRAALAHRDQALPHLRVLAGTGSASLEDTTQLTRTAFDLGADGVVILPAFYYKAVAAEGISAYFEHIANKAVPEGGHMLVYHIPQVTGVPVPAASLANLFDRLPQLSLGMKDSQDELAHTLEIMRQFPRLAMFAGSDSIQTEALAGGAAGTITALANVTAPLNRLVWDAHNQGRTSPEAQARLARARVAMRGLNGPAAMKAALHDLFDFPLWPTLPPVTPLAADARVRLAAELAEILSGL